MSQLTVGQQAPDFELHDTKGLSHRLSDALTRGPVALIFYKSACPTCQFTFQYVQKMFSKMEETANRTLWAISEDESDETRQFATEHGLTFNLLIDEHPYEVSAAFNLEFVPALFLIHPDGKIAVSEYGFTKAGLNALAGFEYFTSNDGLPAARPG
jgi:peroxiredoxin